MSWWTGKDGETYYGGMPHKSYVKRKPKPNGCELKSCADVETGVMLRLEIQKGKLANETAEYRGEYPHHVALGLRMTKPWHFTQRVNNGDAGFGSLLAAKAHRIKELHFRGIVRQAKKFFRRIISRNGEATRSRSVASTKFLPRKLISMEGTKKFMRLLGMTRE